MVQKNTIDIDQKQDDHAYKIEVPPPVSNDLIDSDARKPTPPEPEIKFESRIS